MESYEADTLNKAIIREYAITNSIGKVSNHLNVEREYATEVIRRRGTDELHKMIRS